MNRLATWLCVLSILPCGACNSVDFDALRLLLPALANAPRGVDIQYDLPYVERETGTLSFDLFRPSNAGADRLPLVIMVHGGSWRSGSRNSLYEFAWDVAARGCVAAPISYRLTRDGVTYPAPVADVIEAVRYFRANADAYGVDPDRVALLGMSAGAHLSLLAGLADDASIFDDTLPPGWRADVRAIVNLFGPTDFTADPDTVSRDQVRTVERFLGTRLADAGELPRIASPITYVRADGPPVLTVHGQADQTVPIDQARRLTAALNGVGEPAELIEIPDMDHLPGAIWLGPFAQSYRGAVLDFLELHLLHSQ